MAQMESKWIDTRSFEQITLETDATEKYNTIVDMILRDPRIFAGTQTIYDVDIMYKQQEIAPLLEERKCIQSSIQTLKNPTKKHDKHKKKQTSDDEEVETSQSFGKSIMDKLYTLIGQQQEIDKKVAAIQKELELLKAIQAVTIKEFISLNRLAKHYKETEDEEYLRKGVQWVCDYAERMIAREKQYHASN
jgi:hypothetical protein